MKFVDAHVHLSDKEYTGDIDEIIAEAKDCNVVALVSNSMDYETSVGSLRLAERYLGMVFAALGIHPWNVKALTEDDLQQMLELISTQKQNKALVAIGEIGLDYKYTKIWDKQLMVFDSMLKLAENLDLPVIIHSRGTTSKVRNQIAGYITHVFAGTQTVSPNESMKKGE